jgi:hypothetical protein
MAIIAKHPRHEREPKGGSKLNRSETVTVRLDPKLNYLSELAARAQRRTKSSFIEWAIQNSLEDVPLPELTGYQGVPVSLQEKVPELWHVDEPDRVAALGIVAPALLTHDEQLIWRLVRECGLIWLGSYSGPNKCWAWSLDFASLRLDLLREHWDTFKAVAAGDLPASDLPAWQKYKNSDFEKSGSFDDDLDDDVPF